MTDTFFLKIIKQISQIITKSFKHCNLDFLEFSTFFNFVKKVWFVLRNKRYDFFYTIRTQKNSFTTLYFRINILRV